MSRPQPRRKREHKTNYHRRLKLLKSRKPRIVVRIFSRSIVGQVIDYKAGGDKIIVSVNSTALKKQGWEHDCSNLPAAYLTGYWLAKQALAAKIKEGILDIGFHASIKGSKPYAFAKGAIEGGLKMNVAERMMPEDSRIKGEHIDAYMADSKKPQFSKRKKGILQNFEKVKAKLK